MPPPTYVLACESLRLEDAGLNRCQRKVDLKGAEALPDLSRSARSRPDRGNGSRRHRSSPAVCPPARIRLALRGSQQTPQGSWGVGNLQFGHSEASTFPEAQRTRLLSLPTVFMAQLLFGIVQ